VERICPLSVAHTRPCGQRISCRRRRTSLGTAIITERRRGLVWRYLYSCRRLQLIWHRRHSLWGGIGCEGPSGLWQLETRRWEGGCWSVGIDRVRHGRYTLLRRGATCVRRSAHVHALRCCGCRLQRRVVRAGGCISWPGFPLSRVRRNTVVEERVRRGSTFNGSIATGGGTWERR
jgi:hypothetical protein